MTKLSEAGGELRPGIVHRLDKQTSGAIVVAKDDTTHRKLGEMFSMRRVAKTYIALLRGTLKQDAVTVNLPIARDLLRRTRMTTRRADGRTRGLSLLGGGETDDALRRVHAGGGADRNGPDAPDPGACTGAGTSGGGRYAVWRAAHGAACSSRSRFFRLHTPTSKCARWTADSLRNDKSKLRNDRPKLRNDMRESTETSMGLERNFLHAAHLEFAHPQTGKAVVVDAPLPGELEEFLALLRTERV